MAGIGALLFAAVGLTAVLVIPRVADSAFDNEPVTAQPLEGHRDTGWIVQPYRGLGTWLDVFDFAPGFQSGPEPTVTPSDVVTMAQRGATTLYLQAARADVDRDDGLIAPALLGEFLAAADHEGLDVVASYAPAFVNVDNDVRRLKAIRDFSHEGRTFDGLAVDIEFVDGEPDHGVRTEALLELSRRLRDEAGQEPLGAIVVPPVQLEEVNPQLWPGFPWAGLSELYDVWLPMSYWTYRSPDSPWHDPQRYTEENVRRLRDNVGDPDIHVHPVGGVSDAAGAQDYVGFVDAVRGTRPIGASLYHFPTTPPGAWDILTERLPPEWWLTE